MKKAIESIMNVYEKMYNAMFRQCNHELATSYKIEYQNLCIANNINPHTNLELKSAIDNFINSMQ